MPEKKGYAEISDPDQPTVERDVIGCGHCLRQVFLKPGSGFTVYLVFNRQRWAWDEVPGCFCRVCMRSICPACHQEGTCKVFERKLEESEARDRLRRQVLENYA